MSLPRKLSLSNMQGGLSSPREGGLPSPRVRPGFDGVLSDTWAVRRRTSENAVPKLGGGKIEREGEGEGKDPDIKEEAEEDAADHARETSGGSAGGQPVSGGGGGEAGKAVDQLNGHMGNMAISGQTEGQQPAQTATPSKPPPGPGNLSEVEWSYLDPQGKVQGRCWLICLLDRWPHTESISRALQSGPHAALV